VALTCREWFGPGVEYLWQELGYFHPILASLPEDLWVAERKDKPDKGDGSDEDSDEDEEEDDFEDRELPRRVSDFIHVTTPGSSYIISHRKCVAS
jgi:hypothetical protein